jgi:hypothetical protein
MHTKKTTETNIIIEEWFKRNFESYPTINSPSALFSFIFIRFHTFHLFSKGVVKVRGVERRGKRNGREGEKEALQPFSHFHAFIFVTLHF